MQTPFSKDRRFRFAKNYEGITLSPIAAKIYISVLLNRIQPEVEKVLRRNQNEFRRNRSTLAQIVILQAALLLLHFFKAFDSVRKTREGPSGIPSETVAATMMLYKHTKSLVRSPDGDTSFFDITAGVLQGDTLTPFLSVITLDYVLRTSLDKHHQLGFTLSPRLSSRYPPEQLTDDDYADDLTITADTITNATVLLHNLGNAANEVGLYVNASKNLLASTSKA